MKELTKKILEAGLVDATTAALLARWGMLKPEELAQVQHKQVVHETLTTFLEKLEELLDKEPSDETTNKPMRETRLEIRAITPVLRYYCPGIGNFSTVKDEMGHLMVDPLHKFHPGHKIWSDDSPTAAFLHVVQKVDKLYKDDEVIVLQLTVSP